MSDPKESTQQLQGTSGMTTGSESGDAEVKPSSLSPEVAAELEKLVDDRLAKFESSVVDPKVQQQKDRRFDKLEKTQESQQTMLDRIEAKIASGKDYATAKAEVAQEDRNAFIDQQIRSTQQSQVGDVKVDGAVDVILKAHNLSKDDPTVQRILRDNPGPEAIGVLSIHAAKTATGAPPNVTQMQSTSPGGVSNTEQERLMKEYNERKSKLPRGNVDAQVNLKAEMRQKGLDIW